MGTLLPANTMIQSKYLLSRVLIFREVAGECISGMVIAGNPTRLDNGAWINVFERQARPRY